MTLSAEERVADILNAIDRCQDYEQYLRSDEFGSMAYDAVLRNLGVIGEKALPQRAELVVDDIEDQVGIHAEVLVNDEVAQARDRSPGNIGHGVTRLGR